MVNLQTNSLIHEPSPYLQQHAHNPVDWYPWGQEALKKAQIENKPILLSIGYAACHWCHVMAHESFEDKETADLMNRWFINIKVDKEERPDLDKIYQTSHYYLSQQSGGWPLTIFLTPELTPFFSGTYFPPEDRHQLPGFKKVLNVIAMLYQNQPEDIKKQGIELKRILQQDNQTFSSSLNRSPLELALKTLEQHYDAEYGGFGSAPKFPQASKIMFLLEEHSAMALHTLKKIARGGIYDQLAGGFFRYTVDQKWNIPHFEKMLYDNGQLLSLYSLAAKTYSESLFKPIIKATAEWVIKEMQAPEGGYYSSLDADSEGEEGKFYRWELKELQSLLTKKEYAVLSSYYGFDKAPNFEGYWHFYLPKTLESLSKSLDIPRATLKQILAQANEKLLNARDKRARPFRDEKILTSWNAITAKGMLLAGRQLNEKRYLQSAEKSLIFMQNKLWDGEYLQACYKNGNAYLLGYLDDYAFLLDALLTSLEISWDSNRLLFATAIAETTLNHFIDSKNGGFFFTANNHETLLYRPKTMMDDAIPAGNGILARGLLLLGYLLGENRYIDAAEQTLKSAWAFLTRYPAEHCSLLLALKDYLSPSPIIVLRGNKEEMVAWQKEAIFTQIPIFSIPSEARNLPKALASKFAQGDCCAYICEGQTCKSVIRTLDNFKSLLQAL
jgi:uncharacterized protein YyaL (SSP411 family)